MRKVVAVLCVLAVGACAGRNAAPVPSMTAYDNNLSCEQIQAEILSNEQKAQQLVQEENSSRNSNIAIGAVGFLLFWPALFALDLSDAERVEINALHNRNMHLASLQRDCEGAGSPGTGVASVRAIKHGAYDGKWVAESAEDGCGLPYAMQIEIRNGAAEGMLWRGKLAYNFAGNIDNEGQLKNVLAGKATASNGVAGARFVTVNATFRDDRADADFSMPVQGQGQCTVPVVLTRHQA